MSDDRIGTAPAPRLPDRFPFHPTIPARSCARWSPTAMSAATSCRLPKLVRNDRDWRAAKPASRKEKVRLETWLVAVIANGLGPLRVLKSATSGAVLDELRNGPLDKHGGGSRILDVDAQGS